MAATSTWVITHFQVGLVVPRSAVAYLAASGTLSGVGRGSRFLRMRPAGVATGGASFLMLVDYNHTL